MSDWSVEPHATIPELEEKYQAPSYHEPWATFEEKLGNPLLASQVRALAQRASIGEPDAHT